MRQVQGRTQDRVGRDAVEVSALSRLWLAAATFAVVAGAFGATIALVWLAGVGGWLRFCVAVGLVGLAAPTIWRSRLDVAGGESR
jgi:hypothetical protein